MENYKFAGIDIGSNAIRLLIKDIVPGESYKDAFLKKVAYVRLPLRLGGDVFKYGKIREEKADDFVRAMKIYRDLMVFYGVEKFRACATSATRGAANSKEIIKRVGEESGIVIDIIDGVEESMLLYETNKYNLPEGKIFLSADLGGGSLQMTLFKGDDLLWTHSYKIGTVRMLNKTIDPKEVDMFKDKMRELKKNYDDIKIIGSGGNINKMSKLAGEKTIELSDIKEIIEKMEHLSVSERIKKYELRHDRADVIVHAAKIYETTLDLLDVKKIYVPKIGLADGIIRQLYEKNISK